MIYTYRKVYEFASEKMNDPIIERKKCEVSGTDFPIYKSDLDFYDKISPTFNGKKYKIPTPKFCPQERERRKMLFRNERKLYRRKCNATGEDIISIYSPDKEYKVYKQDYWRSDKWDAITYSIDFNFSKSFTKQFEKLMKLVPRINLINMHNENADYCNFSAWNKNSYLIFTCGKNDTLLYSNRCRHSENCLDISNCNYCNNCYETTDSNKCSNSTYLIGCKNCLNCHKSINLVSCANCYGCSNLSNKEYYFLNKKYSKQEYEKLIKNTNKENYVLYLSKNINGVELEKAYGNNIDQVKNSFMIFEATNVEDSKYLSYVTNMKNSMDVLNDDNSELVYESIGSETNYKHIFNDICWVNKNLIYCSLCHYSQNCFGCVGLKNKQYCIFNKQYSKEEYNKLVPKIIEHMKKTGEWGEFFDKSLSPFGYNETIAQEFFSMNRKEASNKGYKRQNNSYDPRISDKIETIKPDEYSLSEWDEIKNNDNILSKIFICKESNRPFKIQKKELDFYRKQNLPLPTKHPDIRHIERIRNKPIKNLHKTTCDKCGIDILSVYQKEKQKEIYCEKCYQKEVFG